MRRGVAGKLGVVFVVQTLAITLAAVIGVFAAYNILEDVLLKEALNSEAEFFAERLELEPGAAPPSTHNLTGYLSNSIEPLPDTLVGLAPGYHELHVDQQNWLVLVRPVGDQTMYMVLAGERIFKLALLFGLLPLIAVLVFVYLIAYTGYRLSERAVSPMIRLAAVVDDIDGNDQEGFAALDDDYWHRQEGEVQTVVSAVRRLGERLQHFLLREREFTRHASHELRSPLTVIKVAIGILQSEPELSAYTKKKLNRIAHASSEMEIMMTMLLLLSREDDVALPSKCFSLHEMVNALVDDLMARSLSDRVEIEVQSDGDPHINASYDAARTVVGSLLKYFVEHTSGGTLAIKLSASQMRIDNLRAESIAPKGAHDVALTVSSRLADRFGWWLDIDNVLGKVTVVTIDFRAESCKDSKAA